MAGQSSLGRRVVTGIGVAALAVGLYLGSKLSGLGVGIGKPGASGTATEDGRIEEVVVSEKPSANATKQPLSPPDRSKALEVIVDGAGYALKNAPGTSDYVQISLEEIVRQVKEIPGDRDGIRIRIYRRDNALPTAEQQLDDALAQAGVGTSSVQKVEGLLQ